MEMELYNNTCFECSKLITNRYSTSFSQGISAFDKRYRYAIFAVYGFVRYADEIVDTFEGYDQRLLILEFKEQAFKAVRQKISLNPVLQSFQLVVNAYHIEDELILAFFRSMEMDLDRKVYNQDDYKTYIYGSAEVVGLMCLRVFCLNDEALYNKLMPQACRLGAALQKINFLRDINADYFQRGRTYFPGVDLNGFTDEVKKQIEGDIEKDLAEGMKGIKQLPRDARRGVHIAYIYYCQLLKKISKTPADVLLKKRIRISDTRKTWLYFSTFSRQYFKSESPTLK
jgi:15-cis-phytoene synthase